MNQLAASPSLSSREEQLQSRYGDVLTLKEIALIFRFPSPQACRKAIARGQLPIQLIKFPNRRGVFSTAKAVANYLDSVETTDAVTAAKKEGIT